MGDRYDDLVAALRVEFPRFRIIRKDRSVLHVAIHHALCVLTFGKMTSYLDSFTTTIGQAVYVTSDWDDWPKIQRYLTLRHEAIHLRQFRTFTLPGMAILYLLLPLPMGLAWFRAYFEKQAYAESIRATAEVRGLSAACDPSYRNAVISNFTGPAYGWMWPFRAGLDRWYDQILATLPAER